MSVSTPEDLARKIESHGVACTDTDVANRLLTHLRHAQAMGSPDSPEPLEVFARAGGVAALAAAMKANTPVAADWLEGTRPASGIDLAMVQKEGCGVLNNIAASALAGGAATASALREAALLPLLVSTVDAYAQRPDVMHRVLPALAQLVALMPKDGSGLAASLEAEEAKRMEAEEVMRMVAAVVRGMQASAAEDAWVQCSGVRVLHITMRRGEAAQRAMLDAGAHSAVKRALDAAPDTAKRPDGFGFDEAQLRQKLTAMGTPVYEVLGGLAQRLYCPGATGTLQGLQQRAGLNGTSAQVLKPTRDEAASLQSRGRVKVMAAGETLSVQFKNLRVG